METQSGARTALVDPFGRELEEWLRDAPAFRTPYVSDLVVPPVTGPIERPVDLAQSESDAPVESDAPAQSDATAESDAPASFRRERHGRRAAACAPSFPEPPERIALRIGDLAVLVSASSGRSTIERIELLEAEVSQRDADLERLAAWEADVAGNPDPEVAAARAFAHDVFADLLQDAAAEADRREHRTSAPVASAVESVRPASPLLASPVSPVSASTRPTPLVQPATGPSAIQRAAFEEAIRAHSGTTAEVPVVLPEGIAPAPVADATPVTATETASRPGWWARLVARLFGAFRRRSAE